jgi:hypothetical protein
VAFVTNGGFRGTAHDHLLFPSAGIRDQPRNEFGLREVAPVLHRHLRFHHRDLEARRIEDGGEVGSPTLFQRVVGRHVAALAAETETQRFAVPERAGIGGDHGPDHAREPADEERRDALQHIVVRLEPRGEALCPIVRRQRLEAHERLHLVRIAPHRRGEALQRLHIAVGT